MRPTSLTHASETHPQATAPSCTTRGDLSIDAEARGQEQDLAQHLQCQRPMSTTAFSWHTTAQVLRRTPHFVAAKGASKGIPFAFIIGTVLGASGCGAGGFGGDSPNYRDSGPGHILPDAGPPPENELEVSFEPPAVGESALFATNPGAGRVAIVHADDFRIETVAVGRDPLPAVAVPGRDVALSFNRGDRSIHILRAGGDNSETTTERFDLDHDANRAVFSADGSLAFLFEGESESELRTNFYETTLLSLDQDVASGLRVVVGYGPSGAFFNDAGTTLFVITEDGVSVVDLTALPAVESYRAPLIRFGTLAPVLDTQITTDGAFAITRVADATEVRLVNLVTEDVSVAELATVIPPPPDPPDPDAPPPAAPLLTDLDLSVAGDEALAVLRSHGLLIRLPLASFADSTTWRVHDLSEFGVGATELSPDGRWALLYSTVDTSEGVTLLDLMDPLATTGERLPLRKSVRGVAFSGASGFALVLHHREPGDPHQPGLTEAQRIDRSHGYSVIDVTSRFTRLEITRAEPRPDGFVIDDAGERLMIALRDDAGSVRALQILDLATFAVDEIELLAPPTTVGTFPSLERAFVGQEADGGRVTFYLWPTRETHTVAGFELGAGVRR